MHPLVHYSDGYNGQSLAELKLGAMEFLQICHVGAEAQGLGLSSIAFAGHQQGPGLEVEVPGLKSEPMWAAVSSGQRPNPLCHGAGHFAVAF